MQIDEKFAKYIIEIQNIAIGERDELNDDGKYREKIEFAFPDIKAERELEEFEDWIREKISNTPEMKALQKRYSEDKRFDSFQHIPSPRQEKLLEQMDTLQYERFHQYLYDPKIKDKYKIEKALKKLQETQ